MSLEEELDLELSDSDGGAEEEDDQSEDGEEGDEELGSDGGVEEEEDQSDEGEEGDEEVGSDGGVEEEDDQSEEGEEVGEEVGSDGGAEEEEGQSEEGEDDEEEEEEGMSGWADSMSKILKSTKPKNKKNLLLSRARKDYEINQNAPIVQKGTDIEIARDDTKPDKEIKEEDADKEDNNILSLKQQRKLELKQRKLEKAWENLNRMTGDVPDIELETDLVKIATKGVVQLFNAVAQQQKTVKTKLRESRNSEFKKEKVLSKSKEIFESAMSKSKIVGKGGDDDASSEDEIEIKEESSSEDEEDKRKSRKRKASIVSTGDVKKPVWQALQEDFMLDAKMKDWDKDSDSG
ncbi:RRP15-like protein [Orchesella cincta]|uniref:RRP15-like protein n=1 Tax=Orchesella cincta TaxID=48709 RepID=A0A1D2NAR5_ORCCI|nr:RRP15-like protein [Orchesella cincta]